MNIGGLIPTPETVLSFLAAVLGVWGASLLVRAIIGERTGSTLECPGCEARVEPGASACGACGYEARNRRTFRKRRRSPVLGLGGLTASAAGVGAAWMGANAGTVFGYQQVQADALTPIAWGIGVAGLTILIWALVGTGGKGRKHCPKCWYEMNDVPGLRCPECGHEASAVRRLYRRRRRKWSAAMAVLIMLAGAGLVMAPAGTGDRMTRRIPTAVLIWGSGWLPDALIAEESESFAIHGELAQRILQQSLSPAQRDLLIAALDRRLARDLPVARHRRDFQLLALAGGFTSLSPATRRNIVLSCLDELIAAERTDDWPTSSGDSDLYAVLRLFADPADFEGVVPRFDDLIAAAEEPDSPHLGVITYAIGRAAPHLSNRYDQIVAIARSHTESMAPASGYALAPSPSPWSFTIAAFADANDENLNDLFAFATNTDPSMRLFASFAFMNLAIWMQPLPQTDVDRMTDALAVLVRDDDDAVARSAAVALSAFTIETANVIEALADEALSRTGADAVHFVPRRVRLTSVPAVDLVLDAYRRLLKHPTVRVRENVCHQLSALAIDAPPPARAQAMQLLTAQAEGEDEQTAQTAQDLIQYVDEMLDTLDTNAPPTQP